MINLIPLPYKILGVVALIAAAFTFGYYKGVGAGRVAQLKDTVAAYETRQRIDQNTADLSVVDTCIALGGLPDTCRNELRGMDETPAGK
jgi:hypothetical protein